MLLQYIISNPMVTLSSVLVGLLVTLLFQVIRFYSKVKSLPPGPFPLPILGNVLIFLKNGDRLPTQVMSDLSKVHGPVYTFWTGPVPAVIINDTKISKEALTKIEFAGRPSFGELNEVFFGKDSIDIVLSDFGREWEVLRKVSHSAVRKFAISEKLPSIIDWQVKNLLQEIKKQNGNGPFDPGEYVAFLMMSLLATSAFGKEFKMSDPDFKILNEAANLQNQRNGRMVLIAFVPLLKHVFRKDYQIIWDTCEAQRNYAIKQYKDHQATYKEGVIRDFMDAMITAKREAESEDSSDAKYLKDFNIVNATLDLFAAGSETTKTTLLWLFLLLANYPEYQKAIREEVEAAIGPDEIPSPKHRAKCNLLQAFILETMRFKPIVPFGAPHKTIVDTELAGHKIKKDVLVLISIEAGSMDKDIWGDPEVFRPERFLDDKNNFNPKPNQLFLPFGSGRRVCLGEKLATANSFMIVAGFLHQTKGLLMTLPGGPGSADFSPSLDHDNSIHPKPYKVILSPPN